MINFFLKNVQSIIIAIIFITIIEMLLPNGNNKKYVKIVSGIYLVVTILNPFLKLFDKEFELDFEKSLENIQTSTTINDKDFQNYYLSSLKETIKLELKEKGYKVDDIELDLNSDYSEILKITVIGTIFEQKEEIIKYFFENYGLEKDRIIFVT